MNRQKILFWASVTTSALFGVIAVGAGIYLYVNGQNCSAYNDYACAFRTIFSLVVIPYGLAILLCVGLASLPFKITQLIGSIFSVLFGILNFGLGCLTVLGAAANAGDSLISREMAIFLLSPLGIFFSGFALLGVGILGYMRIKEPRTF